MKRRNASVLSFIMFAVIAITFAFSLTVPLSVFAQQCGCFCTTSNGVVGAGTSDLTKDFKSKCAEECKNVGGRFLSCSKDGKTFPGQDLCWTQAECENDEVLMSDGSTKPSEWANKQTQTCPSTQLSKGPPQRYCYNPQEPVTLSVAIETLAGENKNTVNDLGEYIAAIYKLLIPSAALIAVVIIMIGGLQYMLARGDQTKIGKAKTRIVGAVSGMVLILFSWTIAFLIDPGLISFDALRVPKIRQVVFLDAESTCEVLGKFFEIEQPGGNECGDTGILGELKEDGPAFTGIFETGMKCPFSKCPDSENGVCVKFPTGETEQDGTEKSTFSCARCSESFNSGGKPNPGAPPPTAAVCAQFESSARISAAGAESPNPNEHFFCKLDTFGDDECLELVSPATSSATSLDCEFLRLTARGQGTESCRAYDLVGIRRAGGVVEDIDNFYSRDAIGQLPSPELIANLCKDDPCGLAQEGHSCVLFNTVARIDCAQDNDTFGLNADSFSTIYGNNIDTLSSVIDYAESLTGTDSGLDFHSTNCHDVNGNEVGCQFNW